MQKRILVLGIVSISCLVCLLAIVILGTIGVNIVGLWANKAVEDHNFPLEQRWVYPAEEDVQAITIGPNGQIVARTNSSIFTLNATNGELIRSATLPKTFGGSAPIISNETIVVAHSQGTDAYNLETGERLWRATDNIKLRGRQAFPTAADDNVVVIVGGFIAVRDLHTGQLLWRVQRDRLGGDAWAVIGTNNLYVIFLNQIRRYNITTGELNWSVETPYWSLQNALLNNNVLYLENSFNDGIGAFDVQTQTLIWQKKGDFTTQSNPLSIYEDYLFVPVNNHIPWHYTYKRGTLSGKHQSYLMMYIQQHK